MKANKILPPLLTETIQVKPKTLFMATLTASLAGYISSPAIAAFDDAGTDFSEDETETHVWNEALEPIEMVNSILCFTKQMRATDFINEGPYSVLADEGLCFDNDDDESSQSAAADKAPSYMEVIVDSTRVDDTSPLIVDVWIPGMGVGEDGEEAIKFQAVISEGASDTNPFGNFTFNYRFFDDIDDSTPTGGGEIRTINNVVDQIGFTFYDSSNHGGHTSSQSASVLMNQDRTEGIALTSSSWGGFGGAAFALSFNETHVLQQAVESHSSSVDYDDLPFRSGDNNGSCLSRTNFNDAVWRYDLYDSVSGDIVELNSGMSIKYDSDGDELPDSHGHVGYWGLWTDGETPLENGDIVVEEDYDSEATTEYTVVKAPGRLIEYSLETLSLTEARGVRFWNWDDNAFEEGHDLWLVNYLTAAEDSVPNDGFYRVAGLNWQEQGPPVETALETPELIALLQDEVLHLYSEQLGGDIKFLEGSDTISFYREAFINGSETGIGQLLANNSVEFLCFDNCFVGNLTSNRLQDFDGPNSPFAEHAPDVANAIRFDFSADGSNALALVRQGGAEVVGFDPSLTEESLANSPHTWGVRSGPMVIAGSTEADALIEPWDVYDPTKVTKFYVWETGIHEWNQLTTIKDENGEIPTFDKPIQFTYTHSSGNDRTGNAGEHDGASFMLNYGGNGDLWGIPHEQIGSSDRWTPLFNLADGTLLGSDDQYVVKAREVEQTMASAPGACSSMAITDPSVAVPTGLQGTADIGSMPDVDTPPKAIAGELVDDYEDES